MKEVSDINFFMPKLEASKEKSEQIYKSCLSFIRQQGFNPTNNRIYSLTVLHNGAEFTEVVGQITPSNGELVCAIMEEGNGMFLTITLNRGLAKGEPMISSNPEKVYYFKDYAPGWDTPTTEGYFAISAEEMERQECKVNKKS